MEENLTKDVKGLHYKILLREFKEDLAKWRNILYSCIRRINIVKMSALLNLICQVKTISIKISASYFVDIDKLILKFIK